MSSTSELTPRFSIAVPGDWMILNLAALKDDAPVESLVDERIASGIISPAARDQAVALVRRAAADAGAAGVQFAAVLVAHDEGVPLVASVSAAVVRLVAREQDADAASADAEADEGWFAATPEDALAMGLPQSREVELPAGPAVRIERIAGQQIGEGMEQQVFTVQYVVPVQDDGTTIVLSALTPAVRLRAEMDDIFTEIARSLELV